MTINPFDSPRAEEEPHVTPADEANREHFHKIGVAIVAWEKLRWMFNALVAGAGIAGLALGYAASDGTTIQLHNLLPMAVGLTVFGIAANFAYLFGPIIEGYTIWFFGSSANLRPIVWSVGTLLSMLFTFRLLYSAGLTG
jgi:hypothetical protein